MITIDVKGLSELQANLDRMPATVKIETSAILENGAKTFVRNAKRDAPVRFGFLRNMISYSKVGDLTFELVSGSKYSPYQEWGTITKVSVPADLASYAIQFKGQGIRTNGGVNPHPFFFPQVAPTRVLMETGVQSMLKDLKL